MKPLLILGLLIAMLYSFSIDNYLAFVGWFAALLFAMIMIADEAPELPGDFDEKDYLELYKKEKND